MKIVKPTDRTTLLLDANWFPINVITARACFHHFLRDRVIGLDKNTNQFKFDDWKNGEYITSEDDIEESEEVPVVLYKDQPCIRSANDVWALPTIVIVTGRFFRKHRQREYSFNELCQYYKNTCQICLEKFKRKDLSIDHVTPKALNGTNFTSNLTICCKTCNARKGMSSPYYNKEGKLLKGTNLPSNYIFVEDSEMRNEWKDFIWHM
jgi:5-methylcytosine-specific restriction endonuclease McrA